MMRVGEQIISYTTKAYAHYDNFPREKLGNIYLIICAPIITLHPGGDKVYHRVTMSKKRKQLSLTSHYTGKDIYLSVVVISCKK